MTTVASRLLGALVWPRTLDDWVELVSPLHSTSSAADIRARVLDVVRESHDVSTLLLAPSARWPGHRAGQHVLLTAEIAGVRRTRCFSIASAEGASPIAVTVKRKDGGAVTPALVAGALRGAVVSLSAPAGDFVLPEIVPRRLLFVSGGSGITPVMSMLRTLRARGYDGELVFLHYARSARDVIFEAELGRCDVRTTRFHEGDLAARVPDFDAWDTFTCGPPGMMDAIQRAFAARGAASRVRRERFSLASLAPADPPASSASAGDQVTFVRSRRVARGDGGPILALAERAGVAAKSGCRMGICRACVCKKIHGTTRDLRTGATSSEANVDIQLCINAPVGHVEIDR